MNVTRSTQHAFSQRPARAGAGGAWMFLLLLAAWVAAYIVARAMLERPGISLTIRWACTVAPIVLLALVFALWMRAMRRADELEKLIHLIATAIALPLVAVTVLAIGLMQRAALVTGGAVDLWPWVTAFYVLGYTLARAFYHPSEPDHEDDEKQS